MSADYSVHKPGLSHIACKLSSPSGLTVAMSAITVFLLSILDLAGWIFNIPVIKCDVRLGAHEDSFSFQFRKIR